MVELTVVTYTRPPCRVLSEKKEHLRQCVLLLHLEPVGTVRPATHLRLVRLRGGGGGGRSCRSGATLQKHKKNLSLASTQRAGRKP